MDRPRLGRADVRVAASVWALELIPVLVRWTARPSPGRCLRVPLPFEYVHQIGMSDDLGPNLAGRGVVADQSVLNDGDLPGRVLVAVPAHEGVVDPAAFAQTAKPGGGMGGTPSFAGCHQGPASPEAVVSFLVGGGSVAGGGGAGRRRGNSVSGGGSGVVSGGGGSCWWWRLALSGWYGRHCWEHRTEPTSPAGPSNPRLAGTAILARATPTGAERARGYRLNRISAVCVASEDDTSRETAI